MTTPIAHRSIAIFRMPRPAPALITFARAIVTAMTGNASFPKPTPTLPEVTTAINDLETAETAAQARTHGAATTRDQKRVALVALLEQLKAYIQQVADADRENGAGIIQSATLNVRKVPTRTKRVFAVTLGTLEGSIKLVTASAGHRASYEWEWSSDGGKTWQLLPATLQTKTTMTGVQPGTYSFRYRAIIKTGAADWSQPVSITLK
jgi:hypothetical protein